MESGMNFIAGVIVSSIVWLTVMIFVSFLSYWNGATHYDNQLDWTNGFDAGWKSCEEVMKQKEINEEETE